MLFNFFLTTFVCHETVNILESQQLIYSPRSSD